MLKVSLASSFILKQSAPCIAAYVLERKQKKHAGTSGLHCSEPSSKQGMHDTHTYISIFRLAGCAIMGEVVQKHMEGMRQEMKRIFRRRELIVQSVEYFSGSL